MCVCVQEALRSVPSCSVDLKVGERWERGMLRLYRGVTAWGRETGNRKTGRRDDERKNEFMDNLRVVGYSWLKTWKSVCFHCVWKLSRILLCLRVLLQNFKTIYSSGAGASNGIASLAIIGDRSPHRVACSHGSSNWAGCTLYPAVGSSS